MFKKKITPKPGQESVWDYPRPPALESVAKTLRIEHEGQLLAQTTKGFRVLETSHPPVYYLPQGDIKMERLVAIENNTSFCEWKGRAVYWALSNDTSKTPVAWSYPNPNARFASIKDHLAFYAARVDACYVNEELVTPQPGNFYGGWITEDIVGPFKGAAGTWGW